MEKTKTLNAKLKYDGAQGIYVLNLGDKLSEMKVLSFYENDDYVDYAINQILFLNHGYSPEVEDSFQELRKGKVYQYKTRY